MILLRVGGLCLCKYRFYDFSLIVKSVGGNSRSLTKRVYAVPNLESNTDELNCIRII